GGEERELTLELLAELITEVKVEPAKLAVFTDSSLRHDVRVTDLRPNGLKVTRAQCSSPHLVAGVGAGPASYLVTVDVRPSLPEGRHEEVLSILTDDPVYRELRVPVTVVKRSRQGVSAAPSTVELVIPQGQPAPSR